MNASVTFFFACPVNCRTGQAIIADSRMIESEFRIGLGGVSFAPLRLGVSLVFLIRK